MRLGQVISPYMVLTRFLFYFRSGGLTLFACIILSSWMYNIYSKFQNRSEYVNSASILYLALQSDIFLVLCYFIANNIGQNSKVMQFPFMAFWSDF